MTEERDNKDRWNVLSLKEYFDLAVTNLDEKIEQRFLSMKEAVNKAETATEKRFEAVNEFRSTLSDQQRTFIPRKEYEVSNCSLDAKVTEVVKKMDKIENMKQGGNVVLAYIISAISLLIAIASFIIKINP